VCGIERDLSPTSDVGVTIIFHDTGGDYRIDASIYPRFLPNHIVTAREKIVGDSLISITTRGEENFVGGKRAN